MPLRQRLEKAPPPIMRDTLIPGEYLCFLLGALFLFCLILLCTPRALAPRRYLL